MRKTILVLLSLCTLPCFGGDIKGEAELGFHNSKETVAAQVFWNPVPHIGTRVRCDKNENFDRCDLSIGPNFSLGEKTKIALKLGATTRDDKMVILGIRSVIGEIPFSLAMNVKWDGPVDTFFAKALVGSGQWRFRSSYLLVDGNSTQWRVGPEYRREKFFAAPYLDLKADHLGAYIGLRF